MMSQLQPQDLPEWVRVLHETQEQWVDRNWEETLAAHPQETDNLLEALSAFDVWQEALQEEEANAKLIPEIFADGYIAIHLACWGLYKYAHMCLRSELETALRLVFFAEHRIELAWWQEGKELWRQTPGSKDVWGPAYKYFQMLPEVRRFDNSCDEAKRLFGPKGIPHLYSELSKHIHSGADYFETAADRTAPSYKQENLQLWFAKASSVLTFTHILFTLAFTDVFQQLEEADRNEIMTKGIREEYYRVKLEEVV